VVKNEMEKMKKEYEDAMKRLVLIENENKKMVIKYFKK
jgi:hypothetical protein